MTRTLDPDGTEPTASRTAAASGEQLAPGVINTSHLVFFVVAAAAPLTALATNSPIAIAFGGIGAAGAFLAAGVILALFAAGFTAMSLFINNAGAFYVYIARGLGRHVGMGSSFLAVLSYNSIQISLYGAFAVFAQSTISDFTGITLPWPVLVLAAVIFVTVLGYRNIALSANVLAIALAAEIAILAIVAGAIVVSGGGPDNLTLQPLSPSELLGPGAGAMFAFTFLSFIGFEATAIFSEEAKEPRKTIPRATYISIGFLALFYAFIVWAIVVGYGRTDAVDVAQKDPTGMYFNITERYVGHWARVAMEILILTSLLAVLLAFHNAVSRYQYALARERVLPAVFARTHPVHRSPWVASLSQSILAVVVITPFWLLGADPFNDLYVPTTTPGIYGILALQALTAIAVIAFFARNRRSIGIWRAFVAPALGGAGLVAVLYIAVDNVAVITGRTAGMLNVILPGLALVVFVIGIVVAQLFKLRRNDIYRDFGQDREAWDPAPENPDERPLLTPPS